MSRRRRWLLTLGVVIVAVVSFLGYAYIATHPAMNDAELELLHQRLLEQRDPDEPSRVSTVAERVAWLLGEAVEDGTLQESASLRGLEHALRTGDAAERDFLHATLRELEEVVRARRDAHVVRGEFPAALALMTEMAPLFVGVGGELSYYVAPDVEESFLQRFCSLIRHREIGFAELTWALAELAREPTIADLDAAWGAGLLSDLSLFELEMTGEREGLYAVPYFGRRLLLKEGTGYFRDAVEILDLPRGSWRQLRSSLSASVSERLQLQKDLVLYGDFRELTEYHRRAVTRRRGLAWAFAVEMERRRYGRYPDSLDEAARHLRVADASAASVVDPYDGAPFRYARLGGDRYVLFSVGENLDDDGGSELFDERIDPFLEKYETP